MPLKFAINTTCYHVIAIFSITPHISNLFPRSKDNIMELEKMQRNSLSMFAFVIKDLPGDEESQRL